MFSVCVDGKRSAKSSTAADQPPTQTEKVAFFSGIPSVEVTKGNLHLYKVRYVLSLGAHLRLLFCVYCGLDCVYRGSKELYSEVLCAMGVPAHQHLQAMLDFLSPVL